MPEPVIVLAGSLREAEQWCRFEGINPREMRYAHVSYALHGCVPARVVILEGFDTLPSIRRAMLLDTLQTSSHGEPFSIEYPGRYFDR